MKLVDITQKNLNSVPRKFCQSVYAKSHVIYIFFVSFFQSQHTTQQRSQQQQNQVHQLTEENVSIHSQSVDEHYEEMMQYAEQHQVYEEQCKQQVVQGMQ